MCSNLSVGEPESEAPASRVYSMPGRFSRSYGNSRANRSLKATNNRMNNYYCVSYHLNNHIVHSICNLIMLKCTGGIDQVRSWLREIRVSESMLIIPNWKLISIQSTKLTTLWYPFPYSGLFGKKTSLYPSVSQFEQTDRTKLKNKKQTFQHEMYLIWWCVYNLVSSNHIQLITDLVIGYSLCVTWK